MRISADVASLVSAERSVKVEHGEGQNQRQVTFGLSLYKKNHFSEDNETFRVINEYWASLPENSQEEIYMVYEDIRELFDSVTGSKELKEELTRLVTRLMEFHKTKDVIHWVKYKSGLPVPRDIKEVYTYDVDKNTTLDKTYTYEDYIGLMSLLVIFRAMIPIWAMYNKPAKDSIGKTLKEMHSFLLLQDSEVYYSEPLQRLQRYVTANIGRDAYTGNHTLEFICSDDYPFYLLCLVCVRKLCLGELYSDEPKQNLAALVYTYIIDRPGPQGSDYSQQVRSKKLRREGAGETTENSGSTLELYKARASVTVGRIAELEYNNRDMFNLAIQLCPEVNEKLLRRDLDRALVTSEEMLDKGIQTPQQLLMAYTVCGRVLSPHAISYFEEPMVAQLCGLAETVLRHRGFSYLALLVTSVAMIDESGVRVSPVGSKSQIGEETSRKIAEYFPYRRVSTKKSSNNIEHCFVTEDIKKLSTEFGRFTWRATADEALVREVLHTHVRRVPMLPQLRSDIASMLIQNEELIT